MNRLLRQGRKNVPGWLFGCPRPWPAANMSSNCGGPFDGPVAVLIGGRPSSRKIDQSRFRFKRNFPRWPTPARGGRNYALRSNLVTAAPRFDEQVGTKS